MRGGPLLLAAGWVAGLSVATAVGWTAVRFVGDQVSPGEPRSLSSEQVRQALAQGTGGSPVSGTAGPGATTTSGGSASGTMTRPSDTPSTASSAPTSNEVGRLPAAAQPAPAPPPGQTKTYTMTGGTAAVRCVGQSISLLYAQPAAGYQVHTESAGPAKVEVSFSAVSHTSKLEAYCVAGAPVGQPRESSGGDSPDG